MSKCKKCKREVVIGSSTGFKCPKCPVVVCRTCDDNSTVFVWYGLEWDDKDGSDLYLCPKCLKKHTTKSEPERVEQIQATGDNA